MPQLMPLNWMVTGLMVCMIVFVLMLSYGDNLSTLDVNQDIKGVVGVFQMEWYW